MHYYCTVLPCIIIRREGVYTMVVYVCMQLYESPFLTPNQDGAFSFLNGVWASDSPPDAYTHTFMHFKNENCNPLILFCHPFLSK